MPLHHLSIPRADYLKLYNYFHTDSEPIGREVRGDVANADNRWAIQAKSKKILILNSIT